MPIAAERFYEQSHEIHRARTRAAQVTVGEMTVQMCSRPHRYYPVMRYLNFNPGLKVAELGFGNPVMAAVLARACGTLHIVDVTERREGLKLPENVEYTKCDLNDDFLLPSGVFDCVVAMMIVEHLFDPFHSFREILRIAKPGSRIFINLPNIGSFRCRLQLLSGRMPITSSPDWYETRAWDGNHLHYFTLKDTLRLARDSGMELLAIHPVGGHREMKRLRPSFLCHEITYEFRKSPAK
jgi:SAM-dependent methyltransferase